MHGRCAVDDEAAAALLPLTNLADLDVRYCPLTNAGLGRLSRAMTHLSVFAIEGCPATSVGVWRLLCRHHKLKLWLPGTSQDFYRLSQLILHVICMSDCTLQRRQIYC